MLDFVSVKNVLGKKAVTVYPEFIVKKSKDLMIRGKSFYAIWDEETGFWSTDETDVQRMVDAMIFEAGEQFDPVDLKLLKNFSSNKWVEWQKYCKSLSDNYHELDDKVIFSNSKLKKTDYATRTLPYPLEEGCIEAYDELMDVLYAPSERKKLEWAIGAIISGDSKKLQKFIVLYGGPGTGKSTVINIIQKLFEGYWVPFDARTLSSSSNAFALDAFRSNPLIAIQHDGDLSRIEDNTKLNSIVSHETMSVNEKFKAPYSSKIKSFLIMGTNKPVKITDAKSGILRRLIDVTPTGDKIPKKRYDELLSQIEFELPGIAYHCLKVYKECGAGYYDGYIPLSMMSVTNDFYSFIEDNYDFFTENADSVVLKTVWLRYKEYCEDAKVPYPLSMRMVKSELKNYYKEYKDRDLHNRRSVYYEFLSYKFDYKPLENDILEDSDESVASWLKFDSEVSEFDDIFKSCPAQYANTKETPSCSWDKCKTVLEDLDTRKLHYVLGFPKNLIVVDFDLKGEDGKKNFDLNLKAASKWPQTYAELSKSGAGIHLVYYYSGDVDTISRIYEENIEIKVFTGKSSLRRMLTRCNDIPIATISSGLPLKDRGKNMLKEETIKSEKALRDLIARNLRKEIHPNTKPSMDFIYKILEDAYDSGLNYDVRDMRPAIQHLAMESSNQADYCLRLLCKMKFNSEEISENTESADYSEKPIVIFDVEVFSNLFIVAWKKKGIDKVNIMYNPTPEEVQDLVENGRIVGFNNRRYDNHIQYARMLGYTEEELYKVSQSIIDDKQTSIMFGEAYNLSYTDVYDFLSAGNKMSLKKWEIKLRIHHMELGLPWDKPVPKSLWEKVGEYCGYDVIATEAVWDKNESDWVAREILSEWAEMTVNDTTNALTIRLIVGKDPHPQDKFIYTDLSTIFPGYEYNPYGIDKSRYNPGAKIVKGKSIYMGEDPGEGGRVTAKPGIYHNVALLDVKSMHPSSIVTLKIFGEEYTKNFENIKEARICIKEKRYEDAKKILPKKLHKYFEDPVKIKQLGNALKTPINSAYGLTSANFPNKLKDPRNVDNIVAKYGALFMINLQKEVEDRGFIVAHVKTDSIKIPDATPEIIDFCMEYGKKYGFEFDHEKTYSKMCLVNEAVYIAEVCEEEGEPVEPYWTATGAQFQEPYVFKTLFSKEPIEFYDLVQTKSVNTAIYLDMNESLPDVSDLERQVEKLEDKYKKGLISDTIFESECRKLQDDISKGHDYRFVGKIGAFCPMIDGVGAGILLRESKPGVYGAVNGTKHADGKGVYRWMEAEMVEKLGLQDKADTTYHNRLVDEAIETINKFGDFERFVSEDYILTKVNRKLDDGWINPPEGSDENGVPFDTDEIPFK